MAGFRLIPKDQKFIDLFIADGENLLAAARELEQLLRVYDNLDARVQRIRELEHKGDEIDNELEERLERAFVTPFDREDIHELSARLDDVCDGIQETAETLVLYGVKQPTPAAKELGAILAAQAAAGRELIAGQRIEVEGFQVLHAADMQFRGQTHLLHVALDPADLSLPSLRRVFEAAYLHRFGIELPAIGAVLVNLKTSVIGRRRTFPPRRLALRAQAGEGPVGERPVRFAGRWLPTPVWRREGLAPGAVIDGPALVEQMDTTTVLEPGDRAETDVHGNLVIRVAALQP